MQILEKCMEDMKAVYLLNEEKLEFNFRVLTERKQVNEQHKDRLKKRKRYLTNFVRDVRDTQKMEQKHKQKENIKLTKEYIKFTNLFKDLQTKFERFEQSDDTRFNLIKSMNEQEAQALVEKIMHADKVIHLQQLSIPWKPPQSAIFSFLSEQGAGQGTSGEGGSYKGADSATQGNSLMN